MRKYVVPIVALMGIALLTPRSDAANLILKSRLATPGRPVSVPVAVTDVGGTTNNLELWGLDVGLIFTDSVPANKAVDIAVGTDPGGNGTAFSPAAVTGSTEVPVVVSGTSFVGTGATNPDLYVGIVRGTSKFTTTQNGAHGPTSSIGLLRLSVPAGGVKGDIVTLTVPTTYNVANDGTGATTVSRPGASGATSTATAGAAVNAETIAVPATYPISTGIAVPLAKIAIGVTPGHVSTGGTALNSLDVSTVARALAGIITMTDFQKIAADVFGGNGYVPVTNYGGTAGLSYGDGVINSGDLGQTAKQIAHLATNYPVPE